MKVFPEFTQSDSGRPMLWVRFPRAVDPELGVSGEGGFEIPPGESGFGLTYDEWAAAAHAGRAVDLPDAK
jgi:hypothetical protein